MSVRCPGIPEGYEIECLIERGLSFRSDDRKAMVAILRKPSYAERQAEWVAKHGIKPGSKVKVTRKAESGEDGWDNEWDDPDMDAAVGKNCVVSYIPSEGGICLKPDNLGFPYFVLEPVEPKYRAFKDVAEWWPHRDRWVREKTNHSILFAIETRPVEFKGWFDIYEFFDIIDGKEVTEPFGIKEES